MQCSRNRIASISKRLRCCAGLVHSKCLLMRQPLRRSQGVLCCATADTVPVIILVVLWMFVIVDAVAAQAFIGHAQHNGNHSWGSLRKLSMPARKRCTQRRVSSHIAGHGCLLYHKLLMSVKAQLFGDYACMMVKDKDALFDMQHQRKMPCRCAPVLSFLQREMLSTRLVLVYPNHVWACRATYCNMQHPHLCCSRSRNMSIKAEMSPDNASILVCGGGGIALDVTRKLKDMGAWVWMLQRSDSRRYCLTA